MKTAFEIDVDVFARDCDFELLANITRIMDKYIEFHDYETK